MDLVIMSQCQPYLGQVSLYLLTGIRQCDECEALIHCHGPLGLIHSIARGDLNVPSTAPCDFIAALCYANITELTASRQCGLGC